MDPVAAPLTYPGQPPAHPAVVVTDAEVVPVRPARSVPLPEWTAGRMNQSLDGFLQNLPAAPIGRRIPVLSVGSNASPAQLRRKMAAAGIPAALPVVSAVVQGLAVGVSAHVSRAGYLPATPVPGTAARTSVWVVWLDQAGLAVLDATEPNYDRVRLTGAHPVWLSAGQPIPGCWVYTSHHGYLTGADGLPLTLASQTALITRLLDEVPALRALAGTAPGEWMDRVRDPGIRDAIRRELRTAGRVRGPAVFVNPGPEPSIPDAPLTRSEPGKVVQERSCGPEPDGDDDGGPPEPL